MLTEAGFLCWVGAAADGCGDADEAAGGAGGEGGELGAGGVDSDGDGEEDREEEEGGGDGRIHFGLAEAWWELGGVEVLSGGRAWVLKGQEPS